MEEFSVVLHHAEGGARIGQPDNATFIIDSNDRAIFFDGIFFEFFQLLLDGTQSHDT